MFSLLVHLDNVKAVEADKGRIEGMSPLIRVFSEDRTKISSHTNAYKSPSKGSVQVGNTAFYYVWEPQKNMQVAKIQFYSTKPGKAFIRLFSSQNGRPGTLLAESPFRSKKDGWQGISFQQSIEVQSGESYFISYAHEQDVYNCFSEDEGRKAVTFFWSREDVKSIPDEVFAVEVPVVKSIAEENRQIVLQWDKVTYDFGEYLYYVYRDGEFLEESRNTIFVDDSFIAEDSEKILTYTVKAYQIDTGMFSNDSYPISIIINKPEPQPSSEEMKNEGDSLSDSEDVLETEEILDVSPSLEESIDSQPSDVTPSSEDQGNNSENQGNISENQEDSSDNQQSISEDQGDNSESEPSTNTDTDSVSSLLEIKSRTRRTILENAFMEYVL